MGNISNERRSNRQLQTILLFVIAFGLGIGFVVMLAAGTDDGQPEETDTPRPTRTRRPTRTPRPSRTPRPTRTPKLAPTLTPTPRPFKVGVVAGHWQSDSGAVCDDGLQEVTINLNVASRVVAILQYEGYDAELLSEFSDKLEGYQADAFVSIHTDSCIPDASGFKVARVAGSVIPEEDDRLVECLIREYGRTTGLNFHRNSVTYDMTLYHAFGEINPQTPAAIIELGFMDADRELLTEHAYKVAQGVAQGIACFLEGE